MPPARAPVLAIMVFQVAALMIRAFVETRLVDGGEPRDLAKDLSYLVVPATLVALMYPVLSEFRPFLRSLLRRRDLTIRLFAFSMLLGFTLRTSFWGGLISLTSFGILRNPDPAAVIGPTISFGCPEPEVLLLSLFVMSILVPVTEEVINRGLILPSLFRRGKTVAVVASSALFAVAHAPQAILASFVGGIFIGVQMINCKTLWGPLITHAIYNAVATLDSECFNARWNPIAMTPATTGTGLIAMALALISILFAICLAMDRGHRGA